MLVRLSLAALQVDGVSGGVTHLGRGSDPARRSIERSKFVVLNIPGDMLQQRGGPFWNRVWQVTACQFLPRLEKHTAE
jgi:hypothetical protein